MQGCPLSAVLFLISIDPLLWLLTSAVGRFGFGHVFAVADNVAIPLDRLDSSLVVEKCFHDFPISSGARFSLLSVNCSSFCML